MSYMQTTYFFLKERPGPGFRDSALIFTQPMAILPSLVINIWPIPTARALCTATTSIRRMGPHCRICHRGRRRSKRAFWVALHRRWKSFVNIESGDGWEERERNISRGRGEIEWKKKVLIVNLVRNAKEGRSYRSITPLSLAALQPLKCLYAHPLSQEETEFWSK